MRRMLRTSRSAVMAIVALAAALIAFPGVVRAEVAAAPPAAPVHWTLGDVVATALARHPSIGQADADARAAAARRGQGKAATLPQVAAAAGWSWTESPSATSGNEVQTRTATVVGTASQLLTDFGRTRASIAVATDLAASALEGGRSSRVEVMYVAELAFFNVLRAANLLVVSRETVRERETLLKQAQAFYDTGIKARIDVVRAEANLLEARADVAGAENDLQTARLSLLSRMGVDGPQDFELVDTPQAPVAAGDLAVWQREAEDNHPDLKALGLQVSAAQNAVRAARRGGNPLVQANGRLGWTGDSLSPDRSWSVGVQVSVPIFNGYLTRELSAEADARLASVSFALEDRRRQVRLQVQQAAQAIANTEERLQVRLKEREAFAENQRLAMGRYEAGAGDIIEMIDAQTQMAQAESNLVAARFDRSAAVAALYRALGRVPQSWGAGAPGPL